MWLCVFTRNQVTRIGLYVDGNAFTHVFHYFYLDNISLINEPVKVSSARMIADFNTGSLTGWAALPRSSYALESNLVDSGPYALKWTYNDDGVTQWSNELQLNLAAQDWSGATKLRLRFAVDPANAVADAGKTIYMTYSNNGTRVSGSGSVASFQVSSSLTYQTVELSLGAYTRNQVTQLAFYLNGSTYGTGSHLFYLDSIQIV